MSNTLEATLRALIEPERQALSDLVFNHLKRTVERFLEKRLPDKTEYDVLKPHGGRVPGLREATNYAEAEAAMHRASGYGRNREPWAVEWRPDGDDRLRKTADETAEQYIQTFLTRALEKLTPVTDRRPGYTIEKPDGRLGSGTWVGSLRLELPGLTGFTFRLKIITNFTKYGDAYAQYPCTVHDAVLEAGGKPAGASIEEVWASVGYVPPPKPEGPPRKRWTKLVSGSVVEHNGRKILLHTPGEAKKQNIPADAAQVARIEAWYAGAGVEHVDGRVESVKWPEARKAAFLELERQVSDAQAKRAIRQAAFDHFFPAS